MGALLTVIANFIYQYGVTCAGAPSFHGSYEACLLYTSGHGHPAGFLPGYGLAFARGRSAVRRPGDAAQAGGYERSYHRR